MKTCTKCGLTKPISDFGKHAKTRDRLQCHCKQCIKENTAKWAANNPEKVKENNAKWYSVNSEKAKSYSANWRSANKDRVIANRAKYYSENQQKHKISVAKWSAKHPDYNRIKCSNYRARKNVGKLSKDIAERLFKLQRGKCACCMKPLGDDYHLDHIMPLALGGTNTDDNIQLLRASCNNHKRAKHPIDFMQQRGFLL